MNGIAIPNVYFFNVFSSPGTLMGFFIESNPRKDWEHSNYLCTKVGILFFFSS